MNFKCEKRCLTSDNVEKHFVEKCHLSVSFNFNEERMNNQDNHRTLDFYEDDTIEKPTFVKSTALEHTIESRWVTPCTVLSKTCPMSGQRYTAYYHPQTYVLAKNHEFKRLIIENAIKSIRPGEDALLSPLYRIVPSINTMTTPTRPRYELCVFSSRLCPRQYYQLNLWLPNIFSIKSVILECSVTNVFLQTEKPYNYELNMKWPHQLMGHKIIFCYFFKKERRLSIVAEKLNLIEESEEENVDTTSRALTDKLLHSDTPPYDRDPQDRDTYFETQSEHVIATCKGMKKKKNLKVTFNSLDSCVLFQDCDPATDISERSRCNVPTKTKDGCSTKHYIYQMNKKAKNDTNDGSKPNKSSNKGKRNGRKKK